MIFKQIYFAHIKTLTGTITPVYSEPESHNYEWILHMSQISRIGTLLLDTV